MQRFKFLAAAIISAGLLFLNTGVAAAATIPSPSLLIAEIQTGSATSTSEEFIELANVTDQDISVADVRLEYFSASAATFDKPSRTIPLHGSLTHQARYLLASTGYLSDQQVNDTFSPGLAAAGGHLRLVNNASGEVYDTVGWGTAQHPESHAAATAPNGQSLQRRVDSDQKLIDTNDNASDFTAAEPSPTGYIPLIVDTEPDQPEDTSATDDPAEQPPTITNQDTEVTAGDLESSQSATIALQITELLPNPASPQTDAQDEFIELYNPTDQIVSLAGYKLQTGLTYNHSFTFTDQALAPFSYQAFYSGETGATLANSGGKVRLIAPSGEVISQTTEYTAAADGRAWVWDGSSWQWTTTPSPSALNIITTPIAAAKKVAASKTSTAKKKATKTSTSKTPKAKTTKAKAVKGAKTNTTGMTTDDSSDEGGSKGIQPWLLAGVAGLAVLYGAYEYRSDLANFVRKLRFYRKNRRETSTES